MYVLLFIYYIIYEFCRFKNQRDLQKHTEVHNEGAVYHCTVEGCDYSCHTFQTMSHHFKRAHEVCEHQHQKLTVAPVYMFVLKRIIFHSLLSVVLSCDYALLLILIYEFFLSNRLEGCPNINAIFVIRSSPGVTLSLFTFAKNMN